MAEELQVDLEHEDEEIPDGEAPPGKDSDLESGRRQPNAIREGADWLRYHHRLLLRHLYRLVKWTDFWEYRSTPKGKVKHLAFYRFEALLQLAMADLLTEYTEKKKCQVLSVTADHLKELRKHPQYEPVRSATEAGMRKIRDTKGIDSWAELVEDGVSIEVASAALFAKGSKEKQGATDAILDRRSAKKGRGGEQASVHIHLPPEFLTTQRKTLQIEEEILRGRSMGFLPAPEGDVIDASFVRVPDDEEVEDAS